MFLACRKGQQLASLIELQGFVIAADVHYADLYKLGARNRGAGLPVKHQSRVVAYLQRFKAGGSHAQETVFPFTLYLLGKWVVCVKYRGTDKFVPITPQVLDTANGSGGVLITPTMHPEQYRVALVLLQVYACRKYARAVTIDGFGGYDYFFHSSKK